MALLRDGGGIHKVIKSNAVFRLLLGVCCQVDDSEVSVVVGLLLRGLELLLEHFEVEIVVGSGRAALSVDVLWIEDRSLALVLFDEVASVHASASFDLVCVDLVDTVWHLAAQNLALFLIKVDDIHKSILGRSNILLSVVDVLTFGDLLLFGLVEHL